MSDLVVNRMRHDVFFDVLLAGERRYRALSLLWREGCSKCREEYGRELKGRCFRRHFGRQNDTIEARISTSIIPLHALFLQLSENTHMAVPPHEEAHAYTLLFRLIRHGNADFTLAAFARSVGRSPETIRNALRFSSLPAGIQRSVEKGYIPYGIALELTRLDVAHVKRSVLDYWESRAITERHTVEQFGELVTKYLENLREPTGNLFAVMSEEERRIAQRLHVKRTVARETIQATWSWIRYFRRMLRLFHEGSIGYEDSPYSVRSPVRVTLALIAELEALIPHLRHVLRLKRFDAPRATKTLAETKKLAKKLASVVPEDRAVDT